MTNNTFFEIQEKINAATNICLVVHQKADGDALGSALAFSNYLKANDKTHTLFHAGNKTGYLSFINEYGEFSNDEGIFNKTLFDLIIFLDSSDLGLTGIEENLKNLHHNPTVINIDHHVSNTYFGDFNFIESEASSTSEIIYEYLSSNNFKINQSTANFLLLGIYSDTQTLTNLATTPKTIAVVSKLLSLGANIKTISKNLDVKRISTLKLWSRALSRITQNKEHNITYTIITQQDLKECNLDKDDTGGIANFFNYIDEEGINMILTEMDDGTIKGSLRTTSPKYDVAKFAKIFGGGGHKKAAGFRVKGQLKETETGWSIV